MDEEGIVGLSAKERTRLVELQGVKAGRQTLVQAAARMGISPRQAKRVWARFRTSGARGLVHVSRGKPSNRAHEEATRRKALERCRGKLEGFGPTLACEKLMEEGVRVDHETLRRWLMHEGLWKKQRKRGPHRKWRARREHFGELVQMDGSFHAWFGTSSQPCLIDLVDDATSVMSGRFEEHETSAGAMRALWEWIERYGVPRALYTDRKNVYITKREPTAEEQLANRPALTAFGKACHRLGIEIIAASSPQAKGRIERRHGVLQDRLVKELKLEGVKDLDGGNALLTGGYLQKINAKFGCAAASAVDYHRPLEAGMQLRDVFVFDELRRVQNDWTIAWDGRFFQITGPRAQMPKHAERIVVRRRLDGTRVLLRKGRALEFQELPARPRREPIVRPSSPEPTVAQTPWVPPVDHPWRLRAHREAQQALSRREKTTDAGVGVDACRS